MWCAAATTTAHIFMIQPFAKDADFLADVETSRAN